MQLSEIFPDRSELSLKLARQWLLLGLFALVAAGLFSILLVMSRTPAIQEIIPFVDFFHVALVVHVNLSVLIWFMSFACVIFTLIAEETMMPLARLSFYLGLAGTLLLVVCPFFGVGNPIINNYIPTLDHPVFFIALALFGAGVFFRLFVNFLGTRIKFSGLTIPDAIRVAVWLCSIVCLFSILALYISYKGIPSGVTGQSYYEFLYWGGGHILQFNHSLLMLLVWLILILLAGVQVNLSGKQLLIMSSFTLLPVIDAIRIYALHDTYSAEHRFAFTQLMKFGGLTTLPLGVYLAYLVFSSWSQLRQSPLITSILVASATLFLTGGIIGFLIEGVNVVIPAHYHGSVVAVTLAFMGLSYLLMPFLGYSPVNAKAAKWQMYIYLVGQMMHVIGLAWSGGYGAQRKSTQVEQDIEIVIGMGMMGAGGGFAVIAGVMFMVIMIQSIRNKEKLDD